MSMAQNSGIKSSTIEEFSNGIAAFLNPNTRSFSKRNSTVEANIEEVLVRLDEFYGMLDMIQSDSRLLMDELLPDVSVKMHQMQLIFDQIDRLEKFVAIVRSDCIKVEADLKQAESEYSSINQLKKTLPRFFSFGKKKSEPNMEGKSLIQVFKTSDYIAHSSDVVK